MTRSTLPPRGLGRGLSALLDPSPTLEEGRPATHTGAGPEMLPVQSLTPGIFQPRRFFDPVELAALTESIRQSGVLQPLIVRPRGGGWEIIAGERRWRAAQAAGLTLVPVIVKDLSDQEALGIALVENVQRENLTALEEAEAYQRLIHELGHTQEELSRIIGKSRSYIANMLRLMTLPESVKTLLDQNLLSAGHARCLVGLPNAAELAQTIIHKNLSVRQTEQMIGQLKNPTSSSKAHKTRTPAPAVDNASALPGQDGELDALSQSLSERLQADVVLHVGEAGAGRVEILFNSLECLDQILQKLQQIQNPISMKEPTA